MLAVKLVAQQSPYAQAGEPLEDETRNCLNPDPYEEPRTSNPPADGPRQLNPESRILSPGF